MSFVIRGVADFRDILRRLREVEDQAARTGTTVTTPAQAPAGRRGSEQTLAQLGLAVADLSAEVRALRQKQWTVPVQVRNSA